MCTLMQAVLPEEPSLPAKIQGEILLPGARSLVAFVAAWDQLVQTLNSVMLMHNMFIFLCVKTSSSENNSSQAFPATR